MTVPIKKTRALVLAGIASLTFGACASTDTGPLDAGQRMAARGGAIADYGAAWSAGQTSVREGERLVESATKDERDARRDLDRAEERAERAQRELRQAQSDLARGQQMIQQGNQQMREAEADYEQIRNRPPATSAPLN